MNPAPPDGQRIIQERCFLCGSDQYAILAGHPVLTWVQCPCGLVYKRSEVPTTGPYYSQDYFGTAEGFGRRYTTRTWRRVQKSRHQILDLLNHVSPGPLLDVGCSLGYTLIAAQQLGLSATGADISEHAVQVCRKKGFAAEQSSLERLPFATSTFQLVVMKHVLEHTPNPRGALAEVRRVLRPGGRLFIAVPNAAYAKARLQGPTHRFYVAEAHGREHFAYYTPRTMSVMLEREQFKPVQLHPALVHRRAGLFTRMIQRSVAPFRAAGQLTMTLISSRKEFWLVAVSTE